MLKKFRVLLFYPNEPLNGIAPSNLAILSACLKEDGFDVKLFDCTIYKPKTTTHDQLREKYGFVQKNRFSEYVHSKEIDIYEDFIKVVEEYNPNLIGITLISGTIKYALSFIEKIKDKKIPVITGGIGSTISYEKILNTDLVDFVCIGEGEGALVELCNKLMNNEDCSDIKNIYTKDSTGKIIKNPLRPLVNINTLPIPDFSIYEDWRFYRPFKNNVVKMIPIDIDRGCAYVCTYCAAPVIRNKFKECNMGNYYRFKNIDVIFEETKYLIKKII